ncbi:DUF2092 domain-containing protein [Chroococcus sp. FPU101]|uniref:DUF2092 domain-containing protein n=1 Tax=Chroococcus sp. FPU101 TaxID=1974212 RepID=UPI001F5C6901|nr:DUF2092 domain-containing protein [Chroococcus sp. FPU101]
MSGLLISLGARAENVQQTSPIDRRDTTEESHLALEPKAIALLKAMSSRLAVARTMTFTSVTTYESPSRIGPPLVYTTLSEVTLQRPDNLRVIVLGDGSASEFYYDGKTMMAYTPSENLVAVADAPPTLDAALKAAYDLAAIYFPFTDAIVADPYQDIADGLKQAFYIGQSRVVGGTTTDMIAIATDKVFAQIWIGAEDKLPRMIRAVYRDDPARLRHQVTFDNWKLNIPIASDTFTFSNTSRARQIPFARPEPTTSPSPPTSNKPSTR